MTSLAALAVLTLALPVAADSADDPPPGETDDRNLKIQKVMEASVEWYELLPKADARGPLKPQVVLSWRNAVRGWRNGVRDERAKDFLVLWVDDGRPVAAASIFPWQGRILCHEFTSLSRGAGLVARDGEAVVWSPRDAGVEFRDVPAAPAPADSPELRLRQMKSLAERFTATLIGWKQDDAGPEVLRLLPRPLYRYEIKEAQAAHRDLLDGALLAFVQGTDPEALLLLEAVVIDERPRWQYAFSRATSGGLEARLGKEVIWKVEQLADTATPTKPQIVLRRKIDE
jgi:hypothetical protein